MRKPIPAEAFKHGDPKRYRRGCRCTKCLNGITRRVRQSKYLRQTGRGASTTPHRAAQHVEQLRAAGVPDHTIRSSASIAPDVLYRILRREGTIHRSTEARILAVKATPENATGCGADVPGLGTIRRLRALAADGWTATELARRVGKHKQFIVYLQNLPVDGRVRLWVADYVRKLFAELQPLTPEDNGVPPHYAERARQLAAGKGWTISAYWDDEDFDNPDFEPATQDTPRYVSVGENALELLAQGYTRKQAALRLGTTLGALEKNITRYRDSLQEAA